MIQAVDVDRDQPLAFGRDFRLDNLFDAFEVGSKALARARGTLRLVPGRAVEFALDFRKAGLEFLESKGDLLVI